MVWAWVIGLALVVIINIGAYLHFQELVESLKSEIDRREKLLEASIQETKQAQEDFEQAARKLSETKVVKDDLNLRMAAIREVVNGYLIYELTQPTNDLSAICEMKLRFRTGIFESGVSDSDQN